MNLNTAIKLYAAAGTASEGSSVVSPNYANDMRVKDTARRRLVKTNPDVDAGGPGSGRHPGFGKGKLPASSHQISLRGVMNINTRTRLEGYGDPAEGKTKTVDINQVVGGAHQTWVIPNVVNKYFDNPRWKNPEGGGMPVRLMEYKGKYHISDGHHRVAAAILRGDKTITARVRPVTSDDIYANSPDSQSDNAAFVGKKYRVQDISYGHLVSEHDSSASAKTAANARPYSRVIRHPEPQQQQSVRDMARRKLARRHMA